MSFQPPRTMMPVIGFSPPSGMSTTPSASTPEMPSAQVTQLSLVTANGIGRNALNVMTWAEAEARGRVAIRATSRLSAAVTTSRGY